MSNPSEELDYNDIEAPMPDRGGNEPYSYWLQVMPVSAKKKTAGGIIIPDQSIEVAGFMNCIGKVIAIGEGAFKSAKLRKDLGMTRFPEVGEFIRYGGVRSAAYKFKGATVVDVRDDMIREIVDPEMIQHYDFNV